MMTADKIEAAAVPLLPGTTLLGTAFVNAYVKEVLGKKTFGRVLNVGAGTTSSMYRYDLRLNNSEYHTLETSSDGSPTYVGDARNMSAVPSEHYDWVLAFAVLEHVNDMHAVVREVTRVLKPGGYAYFLTPFHNELHFTSSYGDYWRVSPFGYHELLDSSFSLEEIEYWGDCVIDPVSVAVVARKGSSATSCVSRLYYVEGGLDSMHRYVRGDVPLRWTIPIWRLRIDGLAYCLQVQQFRDKFFADTRHSLTMRAADKLLFNQVAVADGTIVLSNETSTLLAPAAV